MNERTGLSHAAPELFNRYLDLTGASELHRWWIHTVFDDIERTVPKIEEYGTLDLRAIGEHLATSRGIEFENKSDADIYGCMFYALGKVSRAIASLERGETPSEDTLFDLSIYAMMARRFEDRGTLGD